MNVNFSANRIILENFGTANKFQPLLPLKVAITPEALTLKSDIFGPKFQTSMTPSSNETNSGTYFTVFSSSLSKYTPSCSYYFLK